MNQRDEVIEAEKILQEAMLSSDTSKLGVLLANDLVFVNHLGQVYGKQDDLNAHEKGIVDIENITITENHIVERVNTVTVHAKTTISGTFAGNYSKDDFMFIRVWQKQKNGRWEITSAQSTLIPNLS